MAIKDLVSNAWTDIDTLKVPINGAYEEADHANALVNNAWQEVWSAESYEIRLGSGASMLNGTLLTISVSWDDMSSGSGCFYIYGNFKKGATYKLYTSARPESLLELTVKGFAGTESSPTEYSHGDFGWSSAGVVPGNDLIKNITPKADYFRLAMIFTKGGASSGGKSLYFAQVTVNDIPCKMPT